MVDILLGSASDQGDRLRHLAKLWLAGGVALTCVTWVCFALGLTFATTAFAYLVVIVLLSLMDSFVSSAVFSAIAIAFLNFFFVEPRFSFQINYSEDMTALGAFLLTAFVVTGLVRRSRNSADQQRERARLLDLTQDAILVRDVDDTITYWNSGAEQLYGWAKHEAVGRVKHELLRPTFPVSFEAAKATLQRTGRWEGELLHTRRDGSRVTVESRWSLQLDGRGNPIGTLETNHDITERKRAQDELQRNQVTIDALPAFVSRYSAQGRREFINERARHYHGVSVAEVESDQAWIAIHPDDIAPAERAWRRSVATGEPFELEMRFRRGDGSYRWQLNRRMAYRDASGRIVRWYGVAFDIEDQKQAQAALRRSETYLAEAQQLSHTGSFGWNTATGELFWSDETFRIFEYAPDTKPSVDVVMARVHPEDAALVHQVIELASIKGEAFDFEHRLVMPNGTVKHVHVVARAGLNGHDRQHFVGAVMDVTARKKTEQALRDSEKRYHDLFQAMAVSFWEVDYTRSRQVLRAVRDSGVTDFGRYFKDNPAFARELMQATRVVDVNDHTAALFGPGSKEALLESILPFWPDESLPDYVEAVLAAIERNEDFSVETRLRRRDGTIFDAHFTMRYASQDRTKGLAGIIDITARKQTFAKLQASERRYRDLFHYMPIGLTQVDASKLVPMFGELRAKGVTELKDYIDEHPEFLARAVEALEVEEVNQHNLELFGAKSAAEMRGPITRYWQPGTDTIRRSIEARYRGEEFFQEETRIARLDGKVVDVLFSTSRPGAIADKSLVGFIDITERKKAEAALRHSEYRYRNMFQAMAASFWELDFAGANDMVRGLLKSGVTDLRRHFADNPGFVRDMMRATRVVDVNDQTVAVFGGGDRAGLLGNAETFWAEESTQVYAEAYVSAVENKPNYSAECKLRRLDGSTFDALFTVAFPPREMGRGTTMIGVIDITARKQSERALRASERRYRNLFQAINVAFFELDFSGVGDLLRELRAAGVTDLRKHFAERPATVRRFMQVTRVLDVNDQTIAQFGMDEDGPPANVEPFWPEQSNQDYAQAILASLAGKPSFSIETVLRRLDGSLFDAHFTVWYSANDRASGVGGVIDITARKQSEAALRASEQRYQNLFQAMAVSFWELDFTGSRDMLRQLRASGVSDFRRYFRENPGAVRQLMRATRIIDVNDQTVALFGRGSKEELLGTTEPMWPEESTQDYAEAILSALGRASKFSIETRLARLDGTTFDAHFTVWYSGDDRTRGVAGVLDISERKEAYAALEQSEQRYRYLFHHMPIPLLQINSSGLVALMAELREQGVTDLAGYIQSHPEFTRRAMDGATVEVVNESTVRLLGARDAQELLGPVARYWKDSPDVYERILLARFRGEEVYQEDIKIAALDGRVLEGQFTVAFPPALAKLGITLNAFVDATEKNRAQARLEQVESDFAHAARVSMLGELTASIAHEVNQPLAAIATNGEAGLRWLARPEPDVAEVRDLTKRILADARRAADVISRVRAMAARRVPEPSMLPLDEVVREALLFLRNEVQSRGVSVVHHPDLSAPRVLADRTQLQQVIVNLAVNAMQAMVHVGSREPMIVIRTTTDANNVICSVEDTGPGIAPQHLGRLFESFFTTKDGGMGMGLPICRSIIEAHGGRISARNVADGGGARFTFALPAAS